MRDSTKAASSLCSTIILIKFQQIFHSLIRKVAAVQDFKLNPLGRAWALLNSHVSLMMGKSFVVSFKRSLYQRGQRLVCACFWCSCFSHNTEKSHQRRWKKKLVHSTDNSLRGAEEPKSWESCKCKFIKQAKEENSCCAKYLRWGWWINVFMQTEMGERDGKTFFPMAQTSKRQMQKLQMLRKNFMMKELWISDDKYLIELFYCKCWSRGNYKQ